MQCLAPIYLGKLSQGLDRGIPCGKCVMCKRQRALEWTTRLKHEMQMHDKLSVFLTLTYNDDNVPIEFIDGKAQFVLCEHHVQKFLKRFRYELKDVKIRYFYCGEYGSQTSRPHYHFILFGVDYKDLNPYLLRVKEGKEVFSSKFIDKVWTYGENQVGVVNDKTIAYVTGYIIDKIIDKREFRVKPYQRMSQKLGYMFLQKNRDRLLRDKCLYIDGKKVCLPRYYVKKLDIEMDKVTAEEIIEQSRKVLRDYGLPVEQVGVKELINMVRNTKAQRELEYIRKRTMRSSKSI